MALSTLIQNMKIFGSEHGLPTYYGTAACSTIADYFSLLKMRCMVITATCKTTLLKEMDHASHLKKRKGINYSGASSRGGTGRRGIK